MMARTCRLNRALALLTFCIGCFITATAEEPRMLPRRPITNVSLVEKGKAKSCIVAPQGEGFRRLAGEVQDAIEKATGARLEVVSPDEMVEDRGLRLLSVP